MKVLDLFSGIGGFSLGLEMAGMETVAFCEYDEACQKVLKKHWPGVPIYKDVRTITEELHDETIELICGGYPCQPFSVAGKRKGKDDDRHLWPAMFDCIKHYKPRWVIGENVAGHINMGLDQVLSDLESEGYEAIPFVIPACAVEAVHRRDRVWIVAYPESKQGDVNEPTIEGQRQIYELRNCLSPNNVANDRGKRGEGKLAQSILQERRLSWGQNFRRPEDFRGRPDIPEPLIWGMAHGIPNRVDRLKQLGNAVLPQIPFILGSYIMQIENGLVS